uniref:Uncharacterized protein n=1 Tax=Strigamia maritima TaxID=126957 RepID=T1JL49_STRMM
MSDRNQIRSELERKKKKLQEMKEDKERKAREKAQKEAEDAATRHAGREGRDIRQETDDMLSSLGIAPPSEVASLLSTMSSTSASELNSISSSDLTLIPSNTTQVRSTGKRMPTLSVISVQATDIPPKEQISYNKQTQTTGQNNLEREALGKLYVKRVSFLLLEKDLMLHHRVRNMIGGGPGKLKIAMDV